MLHLELDLEDVDYEALLRLLSGAGAGALPPGAGALLRRVPAQQRDAIAAGILTRGGPALAGRLEALAAENGLPLRVRALRARG